MSSPGLKRRQAIGRIHGVMIIRPVRARPTISSGRREYLARRQR